MSIAAVIVATLSLLTALVRWRREEALRRVRALSRKVAELEYRLDIATEDRQELISENAKLRRRCEELAATNAEQADQIEALRRELVELRRKIERMTPPPPPPPPAERNK